jgi:hypothetical protein
MNNLRVEINNDSMSSREREVKYPYIDNILHHVRMYRYILYVMCLKFVLGKPLVDDVFDVAPNSGTGRN